MLSDNELWDKCQTNQPITANDLGTNSIIAKYPMMLLCGEKSFYTDGIQIYDDKGVSVTERDKRKYDL